MIIDIKKSIKPVKYNEAIHFLEERLIKVNNNEENNKGTGNRNCDAY